MRVVTLKVAGDGVARLIGYYAGVARDQLHRDGTARGPVDYYLDPGEPPGGWWGSGRAAVGLDGEVLPEELQALLEGRHPATGDRLGRRFGDRSARGFDATFSATKSLSVLWALSPYPWVRAEVTAAHDAAVNAALGWLERHGAVTRRGRDGVDQVDTRGLVAALFRQHTRTADPQLHTHAVIWAKVQDPTGNWLALDARFLKYQQRSIGWVYDAALRSELTAPPRRRLGPGHRRPRRHSGHPRRAGGRVLPAIDAGRRQAAGAVIRSIGALQGSTLTKSRPFFPAKPPLCAPGRTRTHDPLLRRQPLYPAELRGRAAFTLVAAHPVGGSPAPWPPSGARCRATGGPRGVGRRRISSSVPWWP
jgi:conjugative relaxase-like TrwC/TraI family protein